MRSLSRLFTTLCLLAIAGTALGQNAKVQVVHNIPSSAVDTVDVYVGETLVEDNLAFRNGGAFMDVTPGTLTISVNAKSSTSSTDGMIFMQEVTTLADSNYILVAQGTADAPVIGAIEGVIAELAPEDTVAVPVTLSHGIPDAPPVFAFSTLTNTFISQLIPYLGADKQTYPAALGIGGPIAVQLRAAPDTSMVLLTRAVDLINLRGVPVAVFASGYLNPTGDQPAAEVFFVTASGAEGLLVDPTTVAIEATGDIPESISLSNNFPNPFNPSTNFEFTLDSPQHVTVSVFDVTGRLIEKLADGQYAADTYRVSFDAAGLSSGTYIYQIQTAEKTISKTMLLLK